MMKYPGWVTSTAISAGILGLAVAGVSAVLAHRIVNALTRPHQLLDEIQEQWQLPQEWEVSLAHGEFEPPSSCHRSLLFCASDGPLLRGDFWAQAQPAPTIVICHGYRMSRAHLRPLAALEYSLGYNVLLFDFRGHGDSEPAITSGGTAEVHDLAAALAVASQQPETLPGKICIHAFSMGASTALLTLPHQDVAALIADSPYARLDKILHRLVHSRLMTGNRHLASQSRSLFALVAWALTAMGIFFFRLRFGYALITHLDTRFKRWRMPAEAVFQPHRFPTPILLIHAVGDELIPIDQACRLVAHAQMHGIPIEAYFVDHPEHCGAFKHNPQQYIAVLQQFISRHVGKEFIERLPILANKEYSWGNDKNLGVVSR